MSQEPNPTIRGATILTADGCYFDFDNPSAGGITLNAVARGLANTVRFGGQCDRFYSVAEHSVHVSRVVPHEHAKWGLLHDAAEAFIGDMVKPLKVQLPDYAAVEERVEAAVFAAFGLSDRMPPIVKEVDRAMLRVEQEAVMRNNDGWFWTSAWDLRRFRDKPTIAFLPPEQAFRVFMLRATELGL